ncbi:serine/threonine protein kinase [Myxococcus stipitatus DSM 14675]|uniref:non-specific serine/threonine protein kinase n=1 Tax=Myxococcus stipitatus (strain DSM 14675 / JCM 12634 / Mx s8) TaxID=1278073 RepID=L7UFI6_MYXSD|nr:serine/threonine-protein kinase [Myxococcus stipitatus]AGC46347.1 serine/threonine protein kinase [Myxococcus stipitatus DSM 14675]
MSLFICQRCEAQHDTWTGACPGCGGTELLTVTQRVDRMLGRTVAGRYRIVKKLGQGGMGSVYLAEQVGIGQQVAMKFLHSGLSLDLDVTRRFLNEAKSYARVGHPNAVNLHDFGQDEEGNLYISMEYVEGDDLKRLLANVGRLSAHEAGDIILQVADVLAYAHGRGVVHRDLKPENIMVRQGLRGWHVKVLDFGIARIADSATRLTAQGAVAGTPRYMSPEQAQGQDVDSRADIYAVGVVLFELLTGVQPFDGTSVADIMQRQVNQPTPRLGDIAPELDIPALDAVIQKATAKKRVERYATMELFASDLSNALPTLIGRPPISGVNPVVKMGTSSNVNSGTLIYGDGTEDTMLRGASEAPTELARINTGRMTPIPSLDDSPSIDRTEQLPVTPVPAKPERAGFDKTAHAMSPYTPAKQGRAGWVMGLSIAGVLILAGLGVVTVRGGAKDQPAPAPVAESPKPAPSPPPPQPTEPPRPEPEGTRPPEAVVAAEDTAALARKQEKALDRLIEIGDDFNDGELSKASEKLALARSLGLDVVEPKLAELGTKIEDASKRLARARAREDEGNCADAITLYRALKKDYPQLADAQRGLTRCRQMLPPDVSE